MLSQQWRISKNCLKRILEEVAGLIPGQINNDTPCISAPAFWSSHNNPTTSVDNILCPGCISTSCPLPTPNIAPFPEVTWSWLSVPIFFLKTIEKEYPYPTISLLQELDTPKTYYMLSGFKCILSSLPSSQVHLQMVVHLHPLFKLLLAWVEWKRQRHWKLGASCDRGYLHAEGGVCTLVSQGPKLWLVQVRLAK